LFSSWASPAASVPSAASFSRSAARDRAQERQRELGLATEHVQERLAPQAKERGGADGADRGRSRPAFQDGQLSLDLARTDDCQGDVRVAGPL
jgi:hypothetical protein